MKYMLDGSETERLNFRLLKEDDFETWMKLFEHPDVPVFLGMSAIKDARKQCELWFEKINHRYANDLGGMNVLINKFTGQFVGQCGLLIQEVEGKTELEIGYSILPDFWNRGYATEAAIKCKSSAFELGFSDSLISIVHVNNFSSQKVAIKNGMHLEKEIFYKDMPVNIYRIVKQQ